MTALTALPIFDGHNDTLLNRRRPERGGGRSFVERSDRGHIDLPRAACPASHLHPIPTKDQGLVRLACRGSFRYNGATSDGGAILVGACARQHKIGGQKRKGH